MSQRCPHLFTSNHQIKTRRTLDTLVKQIKEQLICEAQETTSHFEQNLPRGYFRVKLADEPPEKGRKKEAGEAGRADLQQ